jgi:hypothetical protein
VRSAAFSALQNVLLGGVVEHSALELRRAFEEVLHPLPLLFLHKATYI